MRTIGLLFITAALAGCAGAPPKPPQPTGDYRPINLAPAPAEALLGTFDFEFSGDMTEALPALGRVVGNLEVRPPVGEPRPVPVTVSLHAVGLEAVLQALGEQGGDRAEIVWQSRERTGGLNTVFVRFIADSGANNE